MRRRRIQRFLAAYAAAAVCSAACFWMHRDVLDANRPFTLLAMVQNRCGFFTVVAVAWLWYEAFRLLLTPDGNRRSIRW